MIKRFLLWCFAVVVLLGLVAGGVFLVHSRSAMGRLVASGAPTTYADLLPQPIDPGDNAADALERARPLIEAWRADYAAFDRSPAGDAFEGPRGRAVGPEARALVADHAALAAVIDDASRRPRYVSVTPPEVVVASPSLSLRSAMRLNRVRHAVLLADGEADRAARLIVDTLRLAKLAENEPSLVSRLMAIVCQGIGLELLGHQLNTAPPSGPLLEELDGLLAQIEDRSGLATALAQERALSLEQLAAMSPLLAFTQRSALINTYERAIELAAEPLHRGIGADPFVGSRVDVLAQLVAPAVQAQWNAEARTQARGRCYRIRLAIESRAIAGDATPTADTLGLPESTLLDPFTGDSLVVEHRLRTNLSVSTADSPAAVIHEAGWWVYSVGQDRQDDGGQLDTFLDVGVAPPLAVNAGEAE